MCNVCACGDGMQDECCEVCEPVADKTFEQTGAMVLRNVLNQFSVVAIRNGDLAIEGHGLFRVRYNNEDFAWEVVDNDAE